MRTLFEIGTLGLLGYMFHGPAATIKDFTLVGIMGLLLLSIVCGNGSDGSYLTQFLSRFKIDGSYAYAMYCNHIIINFIIRDFFPGKPFYPMLGIYLITTIIMSVITTKLINWAKKCVKK